MKKAVLLLRLSYWIVAIADFGIAIIVLVPGEMGLTEVVYPMGLMSAVAFSWGILLVIADRKPLERRWVLIPTIIVVALLSVARIVFTVNGAIEFSFPFLLLGLILIILMAYSYYCANTLDRKG
jgi:hypothetical protein